MNNGLEVISNLQPPLSHSTAAGSYFRQIHRRAERECFRECVSVCVSECLAVCAWRFKLLNYLNLIKSGINHCRLQHFHVLLNTLSLK